MATLTARSPAPALGFGLALALALPSSLAAQSLTCGGSQIFYTMTGDGDDLPEEQKCGFWGFCETPTLAGPAYSMTSSGCDPYAGSCGMRADFSATFPGNHQNSPSDIGFTYSYGRVDLYRVSNGSLVGSCGVAGQAITEDFGQVRVTGSASCANPLAGQFRVVATMCPGGGSCVETTESAVDFAAGAGCVEPPMEACGEEAACASCLPGGVGAGGGGPAGGGPGFPQTGPGATLRYRAGGVGHPGVPGSAAWIVALGRYWSYDATTGKFA